jgi:hypothetical protein
VPPLRFAHSAARPLLSLSQVAPMVRPRAPRASARKNQDFEDYKIFRILMYDFRFFLEEIYTQCTKKRFENYSQSVFFILGT